MSTFMDADIVITSYPGPPARRESRIGMHVRQRERLATLFPNLQILSLCSDYSKAERKKLAGFDCHFFSERMQKYEKHNAVLEELYQQKKPKAILFLDDDVVPAFFDDLPTDPVKVLTNWLENPREIPAPCMFFSCHGIFADMHRRARKVDLTHAPLKVVGWAMLATNQLGVLYREDDMYHPEKGMLIDDFAFRTRCAIDGKLVLKHQRLYFESYQKSTKHSSWFKDQDERKAIIDIQDQYLVERYPYIFRLTKNKLGKTRIVPIWNDKSRNALHAKKALIKTKFGYLPVHDQLRALASKPKKKGFGV